jgi:hypothetical protein
METIMEKEWRLGYLEEFVCKQRIQQIETNIIKKGDLTRAGFIYKRSNRSKQT